MHIIAAFDKVIFCNADSKYTIVRMKSILKKYAAAGNDVKLAILSELEYNLLNGFRTLPLCVGTDLTLRSKKVNYATETSNIFAMYGGVRLMTYNYNDGAWADFCKNKENLNY